MKKNDIKTKIAQLYLVGIRDKTAIEGTIELIKKYQIGGVVLYKRSYSSLKELIDLVNRLKEANSKNPVPLTIAIDQEGGRVNRLPNDFLNFPPADEMFKKGYKAIEEFSKATSKVLKQIGINMNFAPVLDLGTENKGIGDRSYSNKPEEVTKVGKIITKDLIENNIVPVIKHFPGHGSIKMDSHSFLPIIKNKNIIKDDIIPFEELIKDNVPSIMVGHLLIKGLTGIYPASISKQFIQNEIRKKYNYNNLIITDELGMGSIKLIYGQKRAYKLAFLAGTDLFCCKYKPEFIEDNINYLEKIIIKKKQHKKLEEAYQRIINIKKEYKFNDKKINMFTPDEYNKIVKKYI